MTKNILLLTKNYPPQIGGIEKYAFDLYQALLKDGKNVKIIAAGPRNEYLLTKKGSRIIFLKLFFKALYIFSEIVRLAWFMVRSFTEGLLWTSSQHGSVLIWSLDGSISWIAYLMARISNSQSRVTLHGTDVVWNKKIYQAVMPLFWKKMNEVYVISENTKLETLKRGIIPSKVTLVPHTQESLTFTDPGEFDKIDFFRNLRISDPKNKVVLFSIGRWIERKGFHWFLENVMPALDPSRFIYILAGFGPLESQYHKIISEKKLNNIVLVGKINEITKARLFKSSDLFVMPNIEIKGDIEGFGLVLLEASHYGLKSVAANIDGITDAGIAMLPSGAGGQWIDYINKLA